MGGDEAELSGATRRAQREAGMPAQRTVTVPWRLMAATVIGLAVFVLDGLTQSMGAIAVLYTACIVLVASRGAKWRVLVVGALCAAAACVWFLKEQWGKPFEAGAVRFVVALVAIGVTTLLCLVNKFAEEREHEAAVRYRSIFNAAGFAIWESDWSETHAILRQAEALAGREDLETWLTERPEWLERARLAPRTWDMNEEAQRLFQGRRPERLQVGRANFFVHGGWPEVARTFVRWHRGDRFIDFEAQLRNPAGEKVQVVMRITRLEAHETSHRVLGIAIDVTARKEAQHRLNTALTELAHASRVTTLGQLAASIVQQVSQPLSAVIADGRAGLRDLQEEAAAAPETAECLDRAVANAGRAMDVIGRVRDLAGRTKPRAEPIELVALVDDTLALLRRDVQERGIEVRRLAAPNLPAVSADRVQIQQVLMNLILNAAQAMEQKGACNRELTVEIAAGDGVASVSVRDHGGGIADLDRIFEPFVTTKSQGLGMGLAICRSIVEGHGGRIWAANVGDGAEVGFSLPVVDAAGPSSNRAACEMAAERPVTPSS
jgi:C4-dicarboxylate-specific signal transduction histidine kinase